MSLEMFPPHIQQEILATSAALDSMEGDWRYAVSLHGSFDDPKATIYDCYPYLFLGAFPSLTPSDIRPLSIAGRLFACSIILYDKVMDRTSTAYLATSQALSVQAMQWEAYRLLHGMFAPDAKFWQRFHSYLVEHAEACVKEQQFVVGELKWENYTEEVALKIAAGKNGIAKATIAGLVELAHDDAQFESFASSVNHFNIASQMWDDLRDWKEDLRTNTPSLLLARIAPGGLKFADEVELARQTETLAREVYYDGHAKYVIELILESLDRAERMTSAVPDLAWHGVTAQLRRRCRLLLNDVEQIVTNNVTRARRQPAFELPELQVENEWHAVAWDALEFVVKQWRRGFGEARHIMRLANAEGFESKTEFHYGDIFQRALIADTLCDADEALRGALRPVLDYEVEYILSRRQEEGIGGWSYFHDVPEIAPDADDLGQVMQAMLRAGYESHVKQFCEIPLSVLLRDNTRAEGSIETWIVPLANRSARQERQAEFNQTKWGTGPDTDVMANLLFALELYDPNRFADVVRRGATYLEGLQDADGSWSSRWYYGAYYGTYVCVRLLAAACPDSPALGRAREFLRRSQHADGGWGMSDASDPLSTSLALLGLSYVANAADGRRVAAARNYLADCREPDRGWRGVEFIRPRLSDPYGSRTITTQYVLKAALAWVPATAISCEAVATEEEMLTV